MPLQQKVILVDAEEMALWIMKHTNSTTGQTDSFSAWVRECIHLDVLPDVDEDVQNSSYTLDEMPEDILPPIESVSQVCARDPLQIADRAEAEERAREIYESFGQGAKKTEEHLKGFMARWDALHQEVE